MQPRFWTAKVTIVLTVLAVLNLLVAWIGPRMGEPLEFHQGIAQIKWDQMRSLSQEGRCAETVVIGSSIASYAIDPAQLSRESDRVTSAFNASLFGTTVSSEDEWLREWVVPELGPRLVIEVVSSLYFSGDHPLLGEQQEVAWDAARATRGGVLGVVDRALRFLPLFEYRSELSDPDAWRRLLTGDEPQDEAQAWLGNARVRDRGFTVQPGVWNPSAASANSHLLRTQRLLDDFSLDPEEIRAAVAQHDRLRTEGIDVVLVIPPTTTEYVNLHPGGREDYERYLAAVRELAGSTGVPIIELAGLPLEDQHFVDTHHASPQGAVRITRAVAEGLQSLGLPARSCQAAESGR